MKIWLILHCHGSASKYEVDKKINTRSEILPPLIANFNLHSEKPVCYSSKCVYKHHTKIKLFEGVF